jgi:pilus assembly protein CpaC
MARWTSTRSAGLHVTGLHVTGLAVLIVTSWLVPAAIAGNIAVNPPPAQTIHVVAGDSASQSIALGVSKSVVVDLPRDIRDVLVADPKIANAVVRSSRRAYIIGTAVGQTNVFFFDADGKQIGGFDIAVTRDLNGIRSAIRQVLPDADIAVEGIGDGVVLSGSASSQAEAQQAYDIAARLLGVGSSDSLQAGNKIVNAIVVRGRDQIMLKVTVAEVERDIIKQLGINLAGSLNYGTAVVNFNTNNPFSATGVTPANSISGGFKSVSATLLAMDQAGLIHTLAEPNLTAISGESATFVAGGEFPVLNGFTCSAATTGSSEQTCQPSITFKKFGVSLDFTPVVLSEGRISLKVMTEVSDLSTQNALTIAVPGVTAGTPGASATIPSIRTRRAQTTVEIPSGGSLAMAGMIQNTTKQNINGLPGLMELPILGPLFKSRDYINQQTELMVLVTPYVVRAVAQKDLSRPDDGFADPSDPESILLGRLNRIYGVGSNPEPADHYNGKYGFILD